MGIFFVFLRRIGNDGKDWFLDDGFFLFKKSLINRAFVQINTIGGVFGIIFFRYIKVGLPFMVFFLCQKSIQFLKKTALVVAGAIVFIGDHTVQHTGDQTACYF